MIESAYPRISVIESSRNAKLTDGTYVVHATSTASATCPPTCAQLLDGTCYAAHAYTGMHWRRIDRGERGATFREALHDLRALPADDRARLSVAGDWPSHGNGKLHRSACRDYAQAAQHLRAWSYTHAPLTGKNADHNRATVLDVNRQGVALNASTDSTLELDQLRQADYLGPAVTILSQAEWRFAAEAGMRSIVTQGGHTVTICPADIKPSDDRHQPSASTCATCMLCALPERRAAIGFRPKHGADS